MSFQAMIDAMGANAIDTLAGFDHAAAESAGIHPSKIAEWKNLHHIYYGPTNAPAQQRSTRKAALAGGYSLDQLTLIERRITNANTDTTATERRALRLELLTRLSHLGGSGTTVEPGDAGKAGAGRGAYKRLDDALKDIAPAPEKTPRDSIRFSRSISNKRTMVATGDERVFADLEHYLRHGIDPTLPAAPQMHAKYIQFLRGNLTTAGITPPDVAESDFAESGETSQAAPEANAIPHAAPQPLILIPLEDWVTIHDNAGGSGGDDVVLGLTDGTTMTGAQFLASYYATAQNHLQAALFHPEHGAVNLYRNQRGPNDKQRTLLRAITPICPVPGCKTPADYCQYHHITAWKHGGETNLDNLVPLCRYHNQTNNDDDPPNTRPPDGGPPDAGPPGNKTSQTKGKGRRRAKGKGRRRAKPRNAGHIITQDGRPIWQSPNGHLAPNTHPNTKHGALNALFGDGTNS